MTALIILAALVATYTPVDAYPAEGSIRLVGGSYSHEGRVEIYLLGRWGTVCDSRFSFTDAIVVCHQLGYSIDSYWRNRTFEKGRGIIWLQSVACTGYEANLLQCSRLYYGFHSTYCGARYGAGVICSQSRTSESVTEGSIRLAGGSTHREGRLELFTLGHWATVCASSLRLEEATVACRQLGFGTALSVYRRAEFGQGSNFISLNIHSCTGYESNLTQCGYSIWQSSNQQTCHYQYANRAAGVNCAAEISKEAEGSIRLLGGSGSHEGIVQVYLLGQWTTVCDRYAFLHRWDMSDAAVVCQQLGYSGAVAAPHGSNFSVEIQRRPYGVYNFQCSGYEVNITYCRKQFSERCSLLFPVAGVICSPAYMNLSVAEEGSIRLVGGSNSLEGRVEINIQGHWGTVCGNLWDMDDATVVCRQLGYPAALQAHKRARLNFGSGSGFIWLDKVECTGFETNLTQCRSKGLGVQSCSHSQDAGVTCSNQQSVRHSDGDIRLVGGSGPHEGLVEIFLLGVWGRVCTRLVHLHHPHLVVDSTDTSTVVCRGLGYLKAVPLSATLHHSASYDTDFIWLDVICNGSETSLTQCSNLGLGVHNCHERVNENILTVNCSNVSNGTMEENTVRLVGGPGKNAGFVELYFLGQWVQICGHSWDMLDASVVCHELGYLTAVTVYSYYSYNYRHYRGYTTYSYSCTGDESTLKQCSTSYEHRCDYNYDYDSAFVNCSDIADIADSDTEAGAVRLVAGSGPHEGRLEVVLLNTWGTVCGYSWDLLDAIVVCRQLGYNKALSASVGIFGEGSGPIWLNRVYCRGNESNLTECRSSLTSSHCNHFQDAGVICSDSNESAVIDGALRLVDGQSEHEGRVEVYHFGQWGTVHAGRWDHLDAIVVCRQLNYSTAATTKEYSFNSSVPVWLSYVHCTGLENKLTQCKNGGPILNSPSYHSVAGVVCADLSISAETPDEGSIRLVGGPNAHEGYVQMYLLGHWVSACFRYWDLVDATVVCRQLGYPAALTIQNNVAQDFFRGEYSKLRLQDLRCNGNESSIIQCSRGMTLPYYCPYNSVICSETDIATEEKETNVRLVGGRSHHEGHVQMYLLGHWATVCGYSWDLLDAVVVCRQLGYPTALASVQQTEFGGRDNLMWSFAMDCNGYEANLLECKKRPYSCSRSSPNVAGVVCSSDAVIEKEGSVRLVGGVQPHEGLIEMFLFGQWGTLCTPNYRYDWIMPSASTICQHLGYLGAAAALSRAMYAFQKGSGPTWYLNIENCAGNEVNLTQCSRSLRVGLCSEYEVVGVVCTVWRFEQSQYQVSESQRSVTIRIVLNSPATMEVTLLLRAEDVTAEFGMDYGGPKKHQLVIPAGSTSTSAAIHIINDDVSESKEEFRLTIEAEGIVQLVPSDETVIYIVDDDSCPEIFIFSTSLSKLQAKIPCSHLDDSFLPGGMVTARCTANNTWGPLDMSQCTYRGDIPPEVAVAIVEFRTDSSIEKYDIESSLLELAQVRNISHLASPGDSQVYAIRMNNIMTNAKMLASLLMKISFIDVVRNVLVAQKSDYCNCCDYSAFDGLWTSGVSHTFNVCVGSTEAPRACNCFKGLECHHRFSYISIPQQCYLDVDEDGNPDYEDSCIGCCLSNFDLAFQWPNTQHNQYAQVPCSKIHSSFSKTRVRRRCRPDGSWDPADVTSCTFKNVTKNPIFLLTTNVTLNGQQDINDVIEKIQAMIEKQVQNLTEAGFQQKNSSYITTLPVISTTVNGTNTSTIVFVVEFLTGLNVTGNTTLTTAVGDTSSDAKYIVEQLMSIVPSDSCSCKPVAGEPVHLCIGSPSSPCDTGTCQCIDPYVDDPLSGQCVCSLDSDGDKIPDYRDGCPEVYGPGMLTMEEHGHKPPEGCPPKIPDQSQICPAEQDSVWRIQWPSAVSGSTQFVRCPGQNSTKGLGLASRSCASDGTWGLVGASECESVAIREVRLQTNRLISTLNTTQSYNLPIRSEDRTTVDMIARSLQDALNDSLSDQRQDNRSVLPKDLETSTKFVEIVSNLGTNNGLFDSSSEQNDNETEELAEVVVDIVSHLLDERNAPAFETVTEVNMPKADTTEVPSAAIRILESTEKVASAITSSLMGAKPVSISRRNLALHGQMLSFNQLRMHASVQFPFGTPLNLSKFSRYIDDVPQIKMPPAFILAARGEGMRLEVNTITEDASKHMIGVVNMVMNNVEMYLDRPAQNRGRHQEELFPATLVVSSQIPGYLGGEVQTNETVEITFPIKEEMRNITVPPGRRKQFRCAFFNFTGGANGTGGWSYSGVHTEVINETHVRCNAAHLTSFVVLVSTVPTDESPLDYITYIGCSISFLCLIASIVFFLYLKKELIQKLHNFVHLNLCIALALGLFLFLTGIQTATANVYACKVVTAFLHYFFLATFTWTLCEAVLIYILLVKVFGANDKKWIYLYLALGWALPIPVVLISAASRHEYYLIRHSFDEDSPHYNQVKACWLPSEKGILFSFVAPMIAIIMINAVLLTISMVSLAKSQSKSGGDKNKDEQTKQYKDIGRRLFKATVILVPVMGFTWIIGLFAVGEEGKVFAYLFVIASAFQGLFIFLFHVVRHEKVYGTIKNKLPNLKVLLTERTTGADAATGTHSTTKSKVFSSFKFTSSAEGAEDTKGGKDKGVLELTGCAVDDDEMRANPYDVPRPADAYDVPRPTTVATYYNI